MSADSVQSAGPGDIPVLSVSGRTVPEAWEAALLTVYDHGIRVRTEYDKAGDLPSLDATVMVAVHEPLGEPRIHKNFPGGPQDLEVYRQEVVDGLHDHWIDPAAGKWTYTYHERLFAYRAVQDLTDLVERASVPPIDQVDLLVRKLADTPHTRRAQAITWIPSADPATDDPPCLQRLWARLTRNGGAWHLNLNTHWRSRDLFKAWPDNVIGLTFLQSVLAREIEEQSGKPTRVGSYADYSFSLHIYGQDFGQVGGDSERGLRSFFDNFDEESILRRSLSSEDAREMLVLPQLKNLLSEPQRAQWKFAPPQIDLLERLIAGIEEGKLLP